MIRLDYNDTSTYTLLRLLSSREQRQAAWTEERRQWRAPAQEYTDSTDDSITIDVAEALAGRIDARRAR